MDNNVYSSEGSPRFSDRVFAVLERVNWTTLLAGITIGIVGLHMLNNRPLNERLDSMQSELDLVRSGLYDVAGSRTDVAQANDLLTALTEQRSQINSARASLTVIDRLTADVSHSSTNAAQAETSLEQLIDLNNQLIATRERQAAVTAAIDSVRDLQTDVEGLGDDAQQAFSKVEEARLAISEFDQFQQQVVESSSELPQAREALDAVAALQRNLAGADVATGQAHAAADRLIALMDNVNVGMEQIEAAEKTAERLIDLKDGIAENGEQIPVAEQNVEQLIALQEQLATDERLQLYDAASNVERLINIQAEIANQTDSLVDSITALELLGDFQGEFNGQLTNVEEMRRQLTELILLQTTIDQALQVVEPISELGDLRRLDTGEIREAARIILDQRRARLARTADVTAVEAIEEVAEVDDATDDIHSPEIHVPVPVPPEEL